MASKQRDQFTSHTGFVLACVGGAIGLGNIWMFPWRLGQFGGAAFLLPYLAFVYILGATGLMGEYGLGRWAKKGPIGAIDKIYQEKGLSIGKYLGAYPVLTIWMVFLFYSIVAGWILRYLFTATVGTLGMASDKGAFFGSFAGSSESVIWYAIMVVITGIVLLFGVSKGIERLNRLLMPLLLVLLLLLVARSLTLPGASKGIAYLLYPEWSVC